MCGESTTRHLIHNFGVVMLVVSECGVPQYKCSVCVCCVSSTDALGEHVQQVGSHCNRYLHNIVVWPRILAATPSNVSLFVAQ